MRPRGTLLGVLLWLLASGGAHAQGARVDTGLQLRMSDTLGEAANTRVPTDRARPPAAESSAGAGPGLRGLSLRLTSGIRIEDNVLRTDRGERRDYVVVLEPKVYLDGRLGRHDVRVGYEADVERHQNIGSENLFNHNFVASTDLDFDRRLKARLESGLKYGTDARGALDTRPDVSGEPDRWREHSVGGSVTLGRRIARGQVGLSYDVSGLRYLNNGQAVRDFDRRNLTLTGQYNFSPRFSVLTEAIGDWTDYLDPQSILDSREFVALVGVAWEATAKTSGQVKIGQRHRDYHAIGVPSISGFTWDASVNWAPKSYSQFTAYTSRDVTDGGFSGAGGSSTATTDTIGLRWRYGFSERLQFDSGIERTLASFAGGGEDEYFALNAGLRYRVNRWVDMVATYDFTSRSSPVPGGGFESGAVFVGFETRLDHGLSQ